MSRERLEPGVGECPALVVRVGETRRAKLDALKVRTGLTPSEVVRAALDAYLAANFDEHSGVA